MQKASDHHQLTSYILVYVLCVHCLGTYILKGGPVEEAQMLLDDHIVKCQAMTASPFAKPFMDRLGPWEKKLVRFQVRHHHIHPHMHLHHATFIHNPYDLPTRLTQVTAKLIYSQYMSSPSGGIMMWPQSK